MVNSLNGKYFLMNIKIVKTTNSRGNLFEQSKLLKSMTNASRQNKRIKTNKYNSTVVTNVKL